MSFLLPFQTLKYHFCDQVLRPKCRSNKVDINIPHHEGRVNIEIPRNKTSQYYFFIMYLNLLEIISPKAPWFCSVSQSNPVLFMFIIIAGPS